MFRNYLLGFSLTLTLVATSGAIVHGQPNLQYVVTQGSGPAEDPSLIDARVDDGPGSTTQGLQTFGNNEGYTSGGLVTGFLDGRKLLARVPGSIDENGMRTEGGMNGHGNNDTTWDPNNDSFDLIGFGYRASINVWAPDQPNLGPLTNSGNVTNGGRLVIPGPGKDLGFGVRTDANGEMVLYAAVAASDYTTNPSNYEYVIPDFPGGSATLNNLHVIDMIVDGGSNQADFYVDGVAVAHMQDVTFNTTADFSYPAFGDCCGSWQDVPWAIEWFKVETGVTTPHAAPPLPPADPGLAEWVPDSFGNWNSISNWMGISVPNTTRGALLGDAITSPRTIINESSNIALTATESITFDSDQGYTLAGSGIYRLEAASGDAEINVVQAAVAGQHQFQGRVQLGSDTTITTDVGASISFNNEVDLAGKVLTISGNVNLNHSVIDSVGGGSIGGSGGLATSGLTSIPGDLTFDGTMPVSIGSGSVGQFLVGGKADISGVVAVDLVGDFSPGSSYTILSADELIASGLTLGGPDANLFRLLVDGGSLSLVAVPEPTSVLLVALILPLFAWRRRFARVCAGMMLALACVSPAHAVVITPVGATASSEYFDGAGLRAATHTIIDTGLEPGPGNILDKKHNGISATTNGGAMWLAGVEDGTAAQITFDLGATYSVSDLYVWNYSQEVQGCGNCYPTRGSKDVDIYYDLVNPNPTTFAEQVSLLKAVYPPGTPTSYVGGEGSSYDIPKETYALTTPIIARYITFDILNGQGSSLVGLSKVRFEGALAVPTESIWTTNGFGEWGDSANWSESIVPSATRGAVLGSAITDQRTIINEGTATTKSLSINNSHGYNLAGSGTYRLESTSGNAAIDVAQAATDGAHQFQAKVQLGSDTDITTAGAAILHFHNQIDLAGNAMSIDGNVNINQDVTDSIGGGSISGTGTLGTAGATTIDGNLTFNGNYSMYLDSQNTDHFMVDGTANLTGTILVDVLDSFTPTGSYTIFSADTLVNGGLTLGGPDAGMFSLQVTPGASGTVQLIVGATLTGDHNRDGVVNAADFVAWAKNPGGFGGPGGYDDWKANFGDGGGGAGGGQGSGTVPEPVNCIMAAIAFLGGAFLRRNRVEAM